MRPAPNDIFRAILLAAVNNSLSIRQVKFALFRAENPYLGEDCLFTDYLGQFPLFRAEKNYLKQFYLQQIWSSPK